ncbi:MAG: TasA family protein [Eubacteriales bacterium]|mgnify:CR=1 FL=1
MKNFSSKKALFLSVISMVICVSMLIGSTFAWFTDSATANVNTIQAGNLDVELVKADGSPLTTALGWVKAESHENEAVLWEPGCTYSLEGFKIRNAGNLALKYKVVISGLTGDATLLNAIEFTVKKGDTEVLLDNFEGKLLPKDSAATDGFEAYETSVITITGKMKQDAGNEYKGLSIDGIKITVYATQLAYESDSTNKDYDENATYYPVIDAAGLKDALKAGGDISVEKDVPTSGTDTLSARTIITKPTNLNLKGKIVSPDNMGNNSTNFTALIVAADTTIDAAANGGIDTGVNGGYAINVMSGAKLTINSGYYYGGGTAVQVQEGELVINGGFFAVEPYSNPTYGYEYLLNCIDSAYRDGTAKITVKGGTFVNFNPADCKAEGAGTNFVAEGYTVISETQTNGDVWYTVVKEGATIRNVASADDLKAVAAEVKSGDIVRLTNDITVSETIKFGVSGFTFDGNGHTITAAMTDAEITNLKTLLSFGYGSTYCTGVTVKNVKFAGKGGRAMHFHGGSASTLENVTISGEWSLAINFYGTHGAVMTNCNISSNYANKYCNSTIFANEQSANQIVLKGTTIDSIFVNATENGATYANGGIKVIVGSGSTVGTIHTNEGITRTFVTVDGGTVGEILADVQ